MFEPVCMNQRWFECRLHVEVDSVICRCAHLDLPASSLLCYMHYPWVVLFRRHQWMVKLITHAATVLYAWQGWRRHLPFIAGDDRLAPPPPHYFVPDVFSKAHVLYLLLIFRIYLFHLFLFSCVYCSTIPNCNRFSYIISVLFGLKRIGYFVSFAFFQTLYQ